MLAENSPHNATPTPAWHPSPDTPNCSAAPPPSEPLRLAPIKTTPAPKSIGPQEKTVIGHNAGYLSELASHCALDAAAAQIGTAIGAHLPTDAIICLVDQPDLAATSWTDTQLISLFDRFDGLLAAAHTALGELDDLAVHYHQHDQRDHDLQPAALPPASASLPIAALGALTEVIGLFSSETTWTARPVANDSRLLTSAVVHALAHQPHLDTTIIEHFRLITKDNPIVRRLSALRHTRDALASLHGRTQAGLEQAVGSHTSDLDAQIADLEQLLPDGPNPLGTVDRIANLRAQRRTLLNAGAPPAHILARAQGLLTHVDSFLDAITTAPAGQCPPALAAALHEARTADDRAATHLLHVQVNSTGADVISRKWLWNNAVTFLGGAAVSYLLLDTRTGSVHSGSQAATCTFRYSSWRNRIGSIATTLPGPPPHRQAR